MLHMPVVAGHTARLFHGSDVFEIAGIGPLARLLDRLGLETADIAELCEETALERLVSLGAEPAELADPILRRDLAAILRRG